MEERGIRDQLVIATKVDSASRHFTSIEVEPDTYAL